MHVQLAHARPHLCIRADARPACGRQVVLDRVKAADKLPGVSEILLPSERGNRVAAQHIASGLVPIEPNLLSNLRLMASKADAPAAPRAPADGASAGAGAGGMKLQTLLLHPAPSAVTDPYDASGAPLYQTATFGQPSATEGGPYDYTRSGNPTRTMLEEQVSGRRWRQGRRQQEFWWWVCSCHQVPGACAHTQQPTPLLSPLLLHILCLRLRVCSGLRWRAAAGRWPTPQAWRRWRWLPSWCLSAATSSPATTSTAAPAGC